MAWMIMGGVILTVGVIFLLSGLYMKKTENIKQKLQQMKQTTSGAQPSPAGQNSEQSAEEKAAAEEELRETELLQ